METSPQARPAPLFGSCHQPRPKRVALNVPTYVVEVASGLHGDCFVPSLVHSARSDRASGELPELRMRSGENSHKLRHLTGGLRPNDEMKVVGHDAIVEQPYFRSGLRSMEKRFNGKVVRARVEQLCALGSAIHGVIDEVSAELRASWHYTAQSKRSTG